MFDQFLLFDVFALFALFVCYAGFRSFPNGPMFVVGVREDTFVLLNLFIAGPREARNPNLDSDQRISYYACVPCL